MPYFSATLLYYTRHNTVSLPHKQNSTLSRSFFFSFVIWEWIGRLYSDFAPDMIVNIWAGWYEPMLNKICGKKTEATVEAVQHTPAQIRKSSNIHSENRITPNHAPIMYHLRRVTTAHAIFSFFIRKRYADGSLTYALLLFSMIAASIISLTSFFLTIVNTFVSLINGLQWNYISLSKLWDSSLPKNQTRLFYDVLAAIRRSRMASYWNKLAIIECLYLL